MSGQVKRFSAIITNQVQPKFWLLLCMGVLLTQNGWALFFDRRPKPTPPSMSYVLFPAMVDLPGIGQAKGYGGAVAELGGSDAWVLAAKLKGDFESSTLIIDSIPISSKHLTLSGAYLHVKNGGIQAFERGRDSDPDRRYSLRSHELKAWGSEWGFHMFNDQIELYSQQASTSLRPKSVIDADGNEYMSKLESLQTPILYRHGLIIDDTDDRTDPRVGIRLQAERWGVLQSDLQLGDGTQTDYSLTTYTPLTNQRSVLVFNLFTSSAAITRPGTMNPDDYQCAPDEPPLCQQFYDLERKRREEEVTQGNATALGGTQRLRSYPQFRFYDTHSAFVGLEYRWYLTDGWKPFEFLFLKGVHTSWQLAAFQEWGQVNDKFNADLFKDMKTSTGVGLRVVFSAVVFRVDAATGKEGSQTTVFVGYGF